MNGNTASNSIIGGADGPTAIFLAGKLGDGFKTGIVIFVIAMLLLAAVMVLWKPGVKTKYRFIRLSAGNLLIHLMDGLVTFVNTPDLAREGNILVSRFGFGWGALFTANLLGFLVIVLTYLVGTRDYNGAGMELIERAIGGEAETGAFLLKILFTAMTLGAGFKGGEIVPSFLLAQHSAVWWALCWGFRLRLRLRWEWRLCSAV